MALPDPTSEPITLEEARLHCRVDAVNGSHPDDPLLGIYISAAREWCELDSGTAIGSRDVTAALSSFPSGGITFEHAPVRAITSITYIDADGDEQPVDEAVYELDIFTEPRRVVLQPNQTWPALGTATNPIKVNYQVGYSAPDESPQEMPLPRSKKVAMLLIIGHLYQHREENVEVALTSLPMGVKAFNDVGRVRVGIA